MTDTGHAGQTVLFVDDEDSILSSLVRLFRPLGYQVLTACSGPEGLGVLERETVDLVVADMRMPGMDGVTFLEQAARRWPKTMRILLTGFADLPATIEAINKGHIFEYICKPWEDEAIRRSVRQALERKHLEEEREQLLTLSQEQNERLKALNTDLDEKIRERDRLAKELGRELELAREIQQSLLPGAMAPGFPITGINVPARELSGDFYDYFALDDGRIYFNLGDVSGKGVNAALLMAKTSSLFRCLGKQVHEPGRLLAQINQEICDTSTRGMFVTMVAGLYDPATGRVRLVNAGHHPALLVGRDGGVLEFGAQSPPLGVLAGGEFPEGELDLADGSLYLFSDGLVEGRVAHGGPLGMTGLLHMIAALGGRSPQERLQAMVSRPTNDATPRRDDVTIVLVEQAHA